MLLENTDVTDDAIEKSCYICGLDLVKAYKEDNSQQNDLNASTQKFPTMTRFDGQKKELCGSCYKNHVTGMEVYQAKHPEWKYPKARE